MTTYHAMIGNVGYLDCEADNDDQARAKFAVMLDHRGGGLYQRWRDAGMRVSAERGASCSRPCSETPSLSNIETGKSPFTLSSTKAIT
jgi:hypothetical protein